MEHLSTVTQRLQPGSPHPPLNRCSLSIAHVCSLTSVSTQVISPCWASKPSHSLLFRGPLELRIIPFCDTILQWSMLCLSRDQVPSRGLVHGYGGKMGEQMNEHGWMRVCMTQLAVATTVEEHQSHTGLAGSETFNSLSLCFLHWVWG